MLKGQKLSFPYYYRKTKSRNSYRKIGVLPIQALHVGSTPTGRSFFGISNANKFFFFFSKTLNNDGASSEVLKVSDKLGLLLLIGMVLFNSVWTGVPGGFWPRPAQYYRVCDPLSGRDFFTTCRSCTNPQTEKQALFFRFERYDRPNYFSK